ncbi:MAG: hypothetical protein HP495_01060 [Nitrospira sp.]|nr:hypothetical protein [Nitrospira sp.]
MGAVARPFVFAWHFLTTIPLSRAHHEPTAPELAASMAWYPVVGLLIGGGLVAVDVALRMVFDGIVGNALLLVFLVLLTRGLHQDGLADTLDGLAGGRTSAERLAIMRDPRIGALGATGLFLSLILRYAGLTALPHELRGSDLPHEHCGRVHGRRGSGRVCCHGHGSLRPGTNRHCHSCFGFDVRFGYHRGDVCGA